ncbi:MAG: YdcH family protein, partial [Rhodospirillaceae bacterium]|nr:YdcH family protein [Rhodospirillaceae bacterium]
RMSHGFHMEVPMSVDPRIEALKARHHTLEQSIADEEARPLPNDLHIAELKKQKLRIKDEIAMLSSA